MAAATAGRDKRPDADLLFHEKTFHGFLHLLRWILLGLFLLLAGLYFGVMRGATAISWLLIAIAIAVLCFGILSTASASDRSIRRARNKLEPPRG